jgi:hypothetical protein
MTNDRLGSPRGLRKTSILMIATCASVVLGGRSALAVVRSCGPDPVANTTNVLCSAPSGPCNASIVTLGVDVDVVDAGCTFDLGGRALSVQKSLQMSGLGFIRVVNAGDVTITGTGRLKARGDFVQPGGVIIGGARSRSPARERSRSSTTPRSTCPAMPRGPSVSSRPVETLPVSG